MVWAPAEADWTDRAVWRAANPALGTFLSAEFLEQEFTQAEAMPGRQNTFRRLYLNQWTEQADR
jgi:phage terminase large subunit-like protein